MRVAVDGVDDHVRAVSEGSQRRILVGVPEDSTRRDSPVSNALIAYVHEFGSPANNIPARPFLVPSITAKKEDFAKLLAGAVAMEGSPGQDANIKQVFEQVGLKAVATVKNYMQNGSFPPLAEATLERRRTRGNEPNSRTTPLLDTLQLFNSITYVIVDKSGHSKSASQPGGNNAPQGKQ